MHETRAFCSECYAIIPAVIYPEFGKAKMTKVCREHGIQHSIVEDDYNWWMYCRQTSNTFYGGYFVDITTKCNLNCKYCFHDKEGTADRSRDEILKELRNRFYKESTPIVLFGGEPTIHSDFFDVCDDVAKEFGQVAFVTNGTMTADKKFFARAAEKTMECEGKSMMSVSVHKESGGADIATLENARDMGIEISSLLYLIDDIDQIDEAIEMSNEYSDIVSVFRLRSAGATWSEKKSPKQIYTSDMLKRISEISDSVRHPEGFDNNTCFGHAIVDEKFHVLCISCADEGNFDIDEDFAAPWYRAKDGKEYGFITALMVNKGIEKGFYMGDKIENLNGLV